MSSVVKLTDKTFSFFLVLVVKNLGLSFVVKDGS